MSGETLELVEYAAGLRHEDIPPHILQAAKNTICDGVGACLFGFRLPWSQIVYRYAEKTGAGGRSSVLGPGAAPLTPPLAALVNGALAHSFEMDGPMKPGVGAHPFATIFPAALAVAQDGDRSGKQLLTAFVAATEIMLRIGKATKRSNEKRGFHAPGTTGPFGGAIAAGLLLGLDAKRLANAMGVAGSMASGLLQFAKSKKGGMVKRLHFGRAAEGGVLAANLAADDFDAPQDILEGKAGFLRVFCDVFDEEELTLGLGTTWLTERIAMKRFACHGTSQHALLALKALQDQHRFTANDIESITVTSVPELVERHANVALTDIALAQYCLPFNVALACIRDARDPRSFDDAALTDPQIHDMMKRVRFIPDDRLEDPTANEVTVVLKSGAVYSRVVPEIPHKPALLANRDQVYEKYAILTRDMPRERMDDVFNRLQALEKQGDLRWLAV